MTIPREPDGQFLTQLAEARAMARKAREVSGHPAPGVPPTLRQQACDLMESVIEMFEQRIYE